MMSYYKNRYSLTEEDFPFATDSFKRVISLPLFPDMTMDQLSRVTDSVRKNWQSLPDKGVR